MDRLRVLWWLVLLTTLLLSPLAGALASCPEKDCCGSGETQRDDSPVDEACDGRCPPCACCLDRSPASLTAADGSGPVERASFPVWIGVAAIPTAPPLDILKIPKPSLA